MHVNIRTYPHTDTYTVYIRDETHATDVVFEEKSASPSQSSRTGFRRAREPSDGARGTGRTHSTYRARDKRPPRTRGFLSRPKRRRSRPRARPEEPSTEFRTSVCERGITTGMDNEEYSDWNARNAYSVRSDFARTRERNLPIKRNTRIYKTINFLMSRYISRYIVH